MEKTWHQKMLHAATHVRDLSLAIATLSGTLGQIIPVTNTFNPKYANYIAIGAGVLFGVANTLKYFANFLAGDVTGRTPTPPAPPAPVGG